ncbi:hypothetical protein L218DRAFT_863989 [Marasmius fiardii PR-910]|nr:hypothetical protein L218DRAFT_863989 [Marasmius fiardii PR-910]
MNTILFSICLYVLLSLGRPRSRFRIFLMSAIGMYALCTTHIIVNFVRGLAAFCGSAKRPGSAVKYYAEASAWSNVLREGLHVTNMYIYRLYIIWDRSVRIVIVPIIFLLGFSVSGYVSTWLLTRIKTGQNPFDTHVQLPTCAVIGYAFTFCTNVVVTGLIAGRIWWNGRQVSEILGKVHGRRYNRAMAIIIESGAIFSASLLVLMVLYSLKFNAVVCYPRPLYTGIAPTLIIVRAGLGYSVEDQLDCQCHGDDDQTGLGPMRFARNQDTTYTTTHQGSRIA